VPRASSSTSGASRLTCWAVSEPDGAGAELPRVQMTLLQALPGRAMVTADVWVQTVARDYD
jgi:hypothetical protein